MDVALLEDTLAAAGEPAFRARQVWRWAARGATGYDEMTDLPGRAARAARRRGARSRRSPRSARRPPPTARSRRSSTPTTAAPVEAVLMRYRDGRRSVCVSSQSGCPLTCTFCATGAMRFGRNLTAAEIVDQVAALPAHRGRSTTLVFMGMGEPMMNLDAVLGAARRLPDIGIIHRRTASRRSGGCPASTGSTDERRADPPRALAARARGRAALADHAGQRALSRSPRCSRRARPTTRAGAGRCSSSM